MIKMFTNYVPFLYCEFSCAFDLGNQFQGYFNDSGLKQLHLLKSEEEKLGVELIFRNDEQGNPVICNIPI